MQVKQIFSSYDRTTTPFTQTYMYCPMCQAALVVKEQDGTQRAVCPQCGFIYYHNPAPGVVVVIEKDGKVLLGKRGPNSFAPGKWCLPGGFIEFAEDFLTAALREVKEETGLDVEVRSILSVTSNFLSPSFHSLAITLLARIVGGNLCPGDDIVDLQWVPFTGPFPEMAFEADLHIIQRYVATNLTGVPVEASFAGAMQ